ncbi:hypothetical protein ACLOJK_017148 [Asimina triloba]
MATKHRPKNFRKSKSPFSCFPFPACFARNRCAAKKQQPPRNADRKKLPWWARLRARKSGRKTVPVDASVVEDPPRGPDQEEEIVAVDAEVDGKCLVPAAYDEVADQGGVDEVRKDPDPDPDIPSKRATCHKSPYPARKPDYRKSSSSRPGSPDPKPGRRQVLTSSSTFPPPGARKKSKSAGISRMAGQKLTHLPVAETAGFGRSDAAVGMTVLMVSLAFLMLWGRICAIVCTSAWFYFVPRLRTAMDTGGDAGEKDGGGELDLDSSEYKKKRTIARPSVEHAIVLCRVFAGAFGLRRRIAGSDAHVSRQRGTDAKMR